MTSIAAVAPLLAALTSLTLAAVMVLPRPRRRVQWTFALGMLMFAAEGTATYLLLTRTDSPEERHALIQLVALAAVVLPVPWVALVARLANPARERLPVPWRAGLGIAAVLSAAGAMAVLALPAFLVADVSGPFQAVRLERPGQAAIAVQLLLTAGVLAGLELCLRTSRGTARWRIKYLALGLGGVFVVRFYLLSQMLLFHVVMVAYLTTIAAAVAVGNVVIGVSAVRHRLLAVELTVSRHVLYRSVVLGVLGLYLVTVGALGWLLNALGIPSEMLWGSLAIFVSALALAAVLLSENVRWRIRRFIAMHFYRSKYDYRDEWARFTKRLGSLVTVDELAPEVLAAVTEAVGAPAGALYVADPLRAGDHRLAGAIGVDRLPPELGAGSPLVAALGRDRSPVAIDDGHPEAAGPLAARLPEGSLAVPLVWRGTLVGVMALGRERTGEAYSVEDREFLATVGEQLAGAIVTAQLSEALARSREFEAFHRLTSFVVHDLKNSISALSMLSQNALANFDDPEFQRDAIRTLSRTVERMRRLLGRLTATPEGGALDRQPVELAAIAAESVAALALEPGIRVLTDLAPAPPVSGDPDALLRVLQNLVANARDAVGAGGTITVRTYAETGWAVCAVSDTGCGMSEAFVRKSLFVPFRSTKASGWGVGLYQARTIVEGHGGRIDVESREGEGTTFWIRLPAASRTNGRPADPPPAGRAGDGDAPTLHGALPEGRAPGGRG